MRYKLLGRSGLRVSELSLGTMTFGTEWGYGADRAESENIFNTYLEAGGNFLDTANLYTNGTSEEFLGEFIPAHRDNVVLATKYSLSMQKKNILDGGNSRKNLVQSVEASLKRLKTDYIDLMYLHAWDATTPEEEVMRSLDDLVRAGKVLYIGISDTPAWVVSRSNTIAELRGWTRFVALQIEYSLLARTPERDLMPMAKSQELSVCTWGSIGGGALTGKYLKDKEAGRLKPESARMSERAFKIAKVVVEVAEELNCEPVHVALQWVMQHGHIPIVGARTAEQLKQSLACSWVVLPAEATEKLNEATAIDLGFPHEFLKGQNVQDLLFSTQRDKLDFTAR